VIRERLRRARDVLAHRGDAVQCPVCGSRFSAFKPAWNRPNAICWRCGAHERHRALWLYLQRTRVRDEVGSLLHFAPEHALERRLRPRVPRYVTTDLDPAKGELQLDLTALDLPDASFDAALCSHVLEHIPDDAAAMRELRRVVRRLALVMVPLDLGREATYEDPEIVDPAARERHFWQHDHVRVYAPDIAGRLERAGFRVDVAAPPEGLVDRHGLLRADLVFACWKE
jgi:SAM-dependent methyltransferase